MNNMKNLPKGWEEKRLGECGNIFNGNSINEKTKKDKFLNIENGFPYIATKDISYNSIIDYDNGVKISNTELHNFKIAHKNSILICAEGGSAGRKIAFNLKDICFVNKLFALETFAFVNSKYIFYFYYTSKFQEQFKFFMSGLIGGVSLSKFKNILIPIPPLSEQQRIVSILDKAFAEISKAKENTEKNLKNAKEVFESYLNEIFEKKGEDWEEKTFEKCIEKIIYTNKIPKKNFLENGKYPIISQEQDFINGYWNNLDDLFRIKNPIVIFGDHTKVIKYVDFDFVLGADGVKILQTKNEIEPKYFYYYLKSINLKDLGYARHYRLLKEVEIFFPKSLSKQQQIVSKLDSLSDKTKELEKIYQKKLEKLEELKKAILQKAFEGEL